jgi:homogentisate 1,2-dioxygenase
MMNMYGDYKSMQDLQGIQPVFQNTTAQQQAAQQALAQSGQLAQQALGDPSAMKMANALRQTGAQQPKETQLTPQQMLEIARLGANPLSSTSDYATGANGWGNYGE